MLIFKYYIIKDFLLVIDELNVYGYKECIKLLLEDVKQKVVIKFQ